MFLVVDRHGPSRDSSRERRRGRVEERGGEGEFGERGRGRVGERERERDGGGGGGGKRKVEVKRQMYFMTQGTEDPKLAQILPDLCNTYLQICHSVS